MAKNNIMDILGKAAVSKTTKKKDEMPVVNIGEKYKDSIKEWIKRKKEEKTAVSLKTKEEEKLKPAAVEARKKWCLENRKAQKSIKIQAGDDSESLITAAFQQKYSTITTDNQEKLEEIFGDEYNRLFTMHTEITLTDEAMKQVEIAAAEGKPTILDKVMKAVGGPEEFIKLFSITQTIKPTDALDKERVSNEKTAELAQKAIDEGILTPQAPSFSM